MERRRKKRHSNHNRSSSLSRLGDVLKVKKLSLLVSCSTSLLLAPAATEINWLPSVGCQVFRTWTKRRDYWKSTEPAISLYIVPPLWNLPRLWTQNNLTSSKIIMNLKVWGFFEKLVVTQPINEFHFSLVYWEVSTMCVNNKSMFSSAMPSKRSILVLPSDLRVNHPSFLFLSQFYPQDLYACFHIACYN